jgi:hypothetical protein
MPLKKILTRKDIEWAMSETKSNTQAARLLRVNIRTYKKYAKVYKDEETGKSLYDLHSNPSGLGITRGGRGQHLDPQKLIDGEYYYLTKSALKKAIVSNALKAECCDNCGFSERRIFDYSMPLLLDFIDGDSSNKKLDNIQFLCYNCYYLLVDNIYGSKFEIEIDDFEEQSD